MDITPEMIARQPPEAQEIILYLLQRLAAYERHMVAQDRRIAELEERLGMTPANSSLPPSSQHPHAKPNSDQNKPAGAAKKKRGGQPGHKKHERTLVPIEQVDHIVPLHPTNCRGCGGKLTGNDETPLRHQVWELPPIKPIITEYQRHRLTCECCQMTTCATLPEGVSDSQAGPRLTALAAILMSCFRHSKRQTELFFESVLNVPASTGWLVKLQTRATDTLRPVYDELHAAVREESRLGIDETPFKECSQRVWMWVFVALHFTIFSIRGSRKRDELNTTIGPQYEGIVTSDRAKMYHHLEHVQYCWAHLKRDFQSVAEARHDAAREIGEALVEQTRVLFRQHARYRDGTITHAKLKSSLSGVRKEVEALLLRGLNCDHRKTSGMCQELCFNKARLWTFLEHKDVAPTNNHSERALRSAVIWRKLSFGTQSESGSQFVETLLTILETCRRQNKNAIDYITHALTTGKPEPLRIGA